MIKKEIGLYMFLLMVVLTGWAIGKETAFIANEGDWNNASNWDSGIPSYASLDTAYVSIAGRNTVVSITSDAGCYYYFGGFHGGNHVVTINGGDLYTGQMYLGGFGYLKGEMYILDGTVTTWYDGSGFQASALVTIDIIGPNAVLDMRGGFNLGGVGYAIHDILDGMLVVPGEVTDISTIDGHWETWAWGKAGTLVYTYNTPEHPEMTEITAVYNPAAPKGLAVVPSEGITVAEGETTTYTIALNTTPDPNTVTVLIINDDQISVSPKTVVFDEDNWNVPQTITVTGVEDHVADGTKNVLIKNGLRSSNRYTPVPLHNSNVWIPVTVTDSGNDGLQVTESGGSTVVTENGATDSFAVVLTTEPNNPVVVTIDADASQITTDVNTLTFTTANYAIPQTVTVTAVDDAVLEAASIISYVELTSVSLAPDYNDVYNEVAVTVNDNECGAWGYETMDVNKDCKVNFKDFATLSSKWLTCTDPKLAGCVHAN